MSTDSAARAHESAGRVTVGLVGALFFVELTSGVLQGYYIPLVHRIVRHLGIRDADFNWFEAAQLLVSAIVVPVLAKLGDLHGHRRVLLVSTAVTALASWALAASGGFVPFLVAWALQGFYVVWLPLEVALIMDRGRRTGRAASQTRRAAGFLVVALELGAIVGALAGARVLAAAGGAVSVTLAVPALAVSASFFVVLFGVKESAPVPGRSLDATGFALLGLALLLVTGSLSLLHLNGLGTWWAWFVMAAGVGLLWPFARHERRTPDPAIDLAVLGRRTMWPVQLAAALCGISILGAQIPLSTYAATDPSHGYGLGLDAATISYLTGAYLLAIITGALLLPVASRAVAPRTALVVAAFVSGAGYLLLVPFHAHAWQVVVALVVTGVGAGGVIAALPVSAAAAAPVGQSGIATGLTNTTKTVGGAFASATFGMLLGAGVASGAGAASSLAGYLATWTICGLAACVAGLALCRVPRDSFTDRSVSADQATTGMPVRPVG